MFGFPTCIDWREPWRDLKAALSGFVNLIGVLFWDWLGLALSG
jgi:hypothetical protein